LKQLYCLNEANVAVTISQ